MNAARSSSSRQAVNVSSNWSTASTTFSSEFARARARRSSASGCSPGRITTCLHSSLPGKTPPASAGSRPARTTEDLPLPDGPTTPSSDVPTSRATSSATSRSRPKKYSASATSNGASPLKGHTTGRSLSSTSASRSSARCSSTTPPASSFSIERSSARPDSRSSGYLVDSARGLVPGPLARQLVDAAGNALAGLEQPVDGHLVAFGVGGVWSGDLPDRVRVEWAEVERAVGTRGRERLSAFPGRKRRAQALWG